MAPAAWKTDRLLTALMVAVAFILFLAHFYHNRPDVYSHDFDEHLVYMEYIKVYKAVPEPFFCRECGHPPPYYAMGVGAFLLGEALGLHPIRAIQWMSALFYGVYLVFAIRLLKEHITSRSAYFMGLALLLFWPLGINMARLINNDVPNFMAQTAAFYYLLRWWKDGRPASLALSLIWCAVAFIFKANAMIMVVGVGLLVMGRWLMGGLPLRQLTDRRIMAAGLLLALAITAVLSYNYWFYYIKDGSEWARNRSMMIPTVLRDFKAQLLTNDWRNFLTFGFELYVKTPFVSGIEHVDEWNYFWANVLRSSLFGEFRYDELTLGRVLNVTLLVMVLYTLATSAFALARAPRDSGWAVTLFIIALQVGALLAFRLRYPFFCHQNFRFIFMVTPLFALLTAYSVQWHQSRNHAWLAGLGLMLVTLFALASILFLIRINLPIYEEFL